MDGGQIAVKVTLNETPLEKKYRKLKNKLENEKLDLEVKQTNYDNAVNELSRLQKEFEKTKQKSEELNNTLESKKTQLNTILSKGTVTPEEWKLTETLSEEVKNLEIEQAQLTSNTEQYEKVIDKINQKMPQIEASYDKQVAKVEELDQEILQTKSAIVQANREAEKAVKQEKIDQLKNGISGIKSETEGVLKKVARWGLAIFGIRSAYMMIRQAMSTLSGYNEQIGTDLQYIRFVLASALQPIVEKIIDLAYKLLAYINYIAKAWFGVNLFANASAKAFQKTNKGVKDTNKSAKQLQKTLAGFDEMNILQDTGATTIGGGGGGVGTPSTDLSNLDKIEMPEWVKWIADNGSLLADIIKGIGLAFATWEITKLVFGLSGIGTTLPTIFTALSKMSGLQIFGIISGVAIAVVGIYNTIKNLITWIKNPSWENFQGVLSGLETVLIGVGVAMVAINASNPIGWITLAIGAIPKLIGWFKSLLGDEEEQIEAVLTMDEAEKNLAKTRNALKSATQNYKNATAEAKKAEKELADAEKKHKLSGQELYNQVLTGQLTYDKMTKSQKKVYEAYLNNIEAQSNLKDATKKMEQATKDEMVAQDKLAASTYKYKNQYSDYVKTIIDGYNKNKISAHDMVENIMSVMSNMDKETRNTFAKNLPENVKKGFKEVKDKEFPNFKDSVYTFSNGVEISLMSIANAGKNAFSDFVKKGQESFNKVRKEAEKKIEIKMTTKLDTSSAKKALNNLFSGLGDGLLGKKIKKMSGMKTGGILKLASGAVINQPGRGVPLASNVIGGEHGREGILPLTDSQAMAQLGYEIGKNVTVNAYLNNYMNARLIGREMQKVQNEDNFAYNG